MEKIESYWAMAQGYLLQYAPKVLLAIVVLIIGLWLIRILNRATVSVMKKREIDLSLQTFLASLLGMTLKVLLIISVVSMVGVQMTSFIALLGAAGLAVGMALSGTLQNFAGGVMILIFKPFKVGDFIDAQSYMGVVKEILIFNTILTTPDNKTIILPNGPLSTGSMVNFSTQKTRRLDFVFGISYSDDIDQAKKVLKDIVDADTRFHTEPAPLIAVSELADSSVNILVRAWTNSEHYWDIYYEMFEKVKKSFDREGITIPFPQSELHILQPSKD